MIETSGMEYELRANRHRPVDLAALHAEIRRLQEQGYRVRDIAVALRINDASVINVLAGLDP